MDHSTSSYFTKQSDMTAVSRGSGYYDEHLHGGIQSMGSYRSSVSKSKYAPPPAEGEGMIAVHEDAHADTNGAKIVVGDGRVNPAAAYIPDPVKEWKEEPMHKKSRFSGKCVWISIVILVLIIAGAVGGGVGGALGSKRSSNNQSASINSTATPSSTETPSTFTSTPTPTGTASVSWGLGKGYYKGCYTDDSNRNLDAQRFTEAAMSLELCAGLCANYTFFGTENGNECLCGDSLNAGYPQVPDSQCNAPCKGDSSQTCGAVYYTNIYQLSPVSPGVGAYTAQGCKVDDEDRVLAGASYTSDTFMTVDLCAGLCTGYSHFGLEYSTQCYCGNTLAFNNATSSANCNYTCSGDPTRLCGGNFFLDTYSFS